MEFALLLFVFVSGYLVSWIQWYQPVRAKVAQLSEDLRWSRSKVRAQQLDLDRWAEKNRIWAGEVVAQVMQSQQEYPRAKTWKLYQEGLLQSDHLSELNRESDRQQAEKTRWVQD